MEFTMRLQVKAERTFQVVEHLRALADKLERRPDTFSAYEPIDLVVEGTKVGTYEFDYGNRVQPQVIVYGTMQSGFTFVGPVVHPRDSSDPQQVDDFTIHLELQGLEPKFYPLQTFEEANNT